jgi:hypothetical protein
MQSFLLGRFQGITQISLSRRVFGQNLNRAEGPITANRVNGFLAALPTRASVSHVRTNWECSQFLRDVALEVQPLQHCNDSRWRDGTAHRGATATTMAPLGALATLLMFVFLRGRLGDESKALAWSLVFALATPTLFRAAFLNQNAMVAHLVFAVWVLKVGLTQRPAGSTLPSDSWVRWA